uniref:Uncharacterized protein n=1 Tax=Lactuca sativa TaxID=4236 RepID=A0A9R1UYZ3_LACSA|nr:hypothetical protein LSAT_V11C700351810 [Lactuca sativa]
MDSLEKDLKQQEKWRLSIGSLLALNFVLHGKWWCNLTNENGSLWKEVVKSLHGTDSDIGRTILIYYQGNTWDKITHIHIVTTRIPRY